MFETKKPTAFGSGSILTTTNPRGRLNESFTH